MLCIFVYVCVFMIGQIIENQFQEIGVVGFQVELCWIVIEMVFGSIVIVQCCGFFWFMDKLEFGDILIVIKFDRFGCDVIDVSIIVRMLVEMGVCVYCFVFGGVDFISLFGIMIMNVFNVVVQFEWDLLIEWI